MNREEFNFLKKEEDKKEDLRLRKHYAKVYLAYDPIVVKEGRTPLALNASNFNNLIGEGFKLVLRPPSDIFKYIVHNGEEINPSREIGKMLNGGEYSPYFNNIELNEYGSLRIDFGDHTSGYSLNFEALPVLEKLHEWHFDIYNLIGRILAFNINELKGGSR